MSVRTIKAGSVNQSVTLVIVDSTDGTPETGVVFDTAGIDLWYRRDGAAKVSITEATLAALTDAHSDGGFLHISDGKYRLDLPDAAVADGVATVEIGGTVTGMVVLGPTIQLSPLPADVMQIGGDAQSATDLKDFADAGYDPATNKVQGVVLVDTTTTNTDMRGTDSAATAAAVSTVSTNVSAIQTILSGITRLAEWLGLIAGKQTGNATARTELRATGAGSGTYDETADSLEAVRDRGDVAWITSAGTGTGARSVTVTVNDGASALESANVRMTKGAETYVTATNASGVASFSLDDGTWTVAITLAGYTFTSTTLVVDGTETPTYSMTALVITPSEAGKTTGYLVVYSRLGVVEAGVTVYCRAYNPGSGSTGIALSGAERTAVSVVTTGLAEFTNLIKGARYEFSADGDTWLEPVTVSAAAGATYALPSIIV